MIDAKLLPWSDRWRDALTVGAKRALPGLAMVLALLVAAFLVSSAPSAFAQTNGPDKPVAGAVPGNASSGTAADAEMWRKIRHGFEGTVLSLIHI